MKGNRAHRHRAFSAARRHEAWIRCVQHGVFIASKGMGRPLQRRRSCCGQAAIPPPPRCGAPAEGHQAAARQQQLPDRRQEGLQGGRGHVRNGRRRARGGLGTVCVPGPAVRAAPAPPAAARGGRPNPQPSLSSIASPCSPLQAPSPAGTAVAAASGDPSLDRGSTPGSLAPSARYCPGHRCCSCASGCVAVAACRWAPSPSSWLLGAPGRGLAANAGVVGCPEPIGRGGRGGMTD